MTRSTFSFTTLLCIAAALAGATGCTFVGQGEGEVVSDNLIVPQCWFGAFDMNPDFFAAVPYREDMQIRVQRSSDLQEVSDGLSLLVSDVPTIRAQLEQARVAGAAVPALEVGLAPKLLNDIAPGKATGAPPPVSMALYLQFSCHNQNVVLYAVGGTITFNELFSGDPNESVGADKLTDATFDVIMADPRDAIPGTLDIPDDKKSRVTGYFRFHFQRGQPGQPFP